MSRFYNQALEGKKAEKVISLESLSANLFCGEISLIIVIFIVLILPDKFENLQS